MIDFVRGNIFNTEAIVLVNPVNCVGVMGKGLARDFKRKHPAMFVAYERLCDRGGLIPGGIFWYEVDDYYVANMATKNHWENPSEYWWIERGLRTLHMDMRRKGYNTGALPRIGCGNGGLDFTVVKQMIVKEFGDLRDIHLEVYV